MEIPITIEKHCIETEARRLYEKLLGRYFGKSVSASEKNIYETRIDAVLFFLGHADFQLLRHRHSELNGTSKCQVILDIDTQKERIAIRCRGKDLPVPFKVSHESSCGV